MKEYIIISPVRDEEEFVEITIESVVKQTIIPKKFIIVNDGSSDRTGEIIERWSEKVEWIEHINIPDRGKRDSAGGEITAFYEGYKRIKNSDWSYIVKLDGDLSFEEDYFENCLKRFENESRLGIASGEVFDVIDGVPSIVKAPDFHVRGAAKMYRRKCWEDIGGLLQIPGWDTIDLMKAHQCGWITRTLKDIHVLHLNQTGSKYGLWRNAVKNGQCNYNTGYEHLFMMLKCLKRVWSQPYFIDGLGLFWGYMIGHVKRNRIKDKELLKYVKKQQIAFLLNKESIWRKGYQNQLQENSNQQ